MVLAQIAPGRTVPILERGRAIGDSRVVCGVHNASAVEGARMLVGATMAAGDGNRGLSERSCSREAGIFCAARTTACRTGAGALREWSASSSPMHNPAERAATALAAL